MSQRDPVNFTCGLLYVNGSVLLDRAISNYGCSGPFSNDDYFYVRYKPAKIAIERRGYAFFLTIRATKNPDSPLAMMSPNIIGIIANYMLMQKMFDEKKKEI
jgi:hypothetical protein